MRCEHEVSGRGGIEDLSSGTIVPGGVAVTMPGMTVNGRPGDQNRAGFRGQWQCCTALHPRPLPGQPPFQLTFSANGTAVTDMLKAPDSHWQGDVTVVFDSDP